MRLLLTISLLFNTSQAQFHPGDTMHLPMAIVLTDSSSLYNVYYKSGQVKQSQVTWSQVRIPVGGSYEAIDYKGGQWFSSKGYCVMQVIDTLGNMETIQYLGLNKKPFPPPYIPTGYDYPREGMPPKK